MTAIASHTSDFTAGETYSMLLQYYVGWFIFMLISLYILKKNVDRIQSSHDQKSVTEVTQEFKLFQRSYIIVYLLMMGADWLQGPYVYALYRHYGYSQLEIGRLFIAGFGSSLIFGTFVGSLTDKYGRKLSCVVFGVLYSLSCITKHYNDYNVLMFGRVLGGVSTSILFSAFESWMVHQHHEASYPEEWLGSTFAVATSGNGAVAIAAGVFANNLRDVFGPVAPFDASLVLLLVGTVYIVANWKENYGDSHSNLLANMSNAWTRLWEDEKIMLLGCVQSCFEGAMYIFVFMWTPALESTSNSAVFHGWVFATFMICVLAGSTIFSLTLKLGYRVERTAVYVFGVAAVSLMVPALIKQHTIRLLSFFVFEVCVGLFWPSLGFMRSRYVPEEVRATVMNFFRVPLNMIVVIVLANLDGLAEIHVFAICACCLLPTLMCQARLLTLTADNQESMTKKGVELDVV